MNEETKFKLKAFFWNQFILPFKVFFTSTNIKLLSVIALAFSIIILKSRELTFVVLALILIVTFYDVYKDFKSGVYVGEYRKYKYSDYRKATRDIKRDIWTKSPPPKDLNTLNNLNHDGKEKETTQGTPEVRSLSSLARNSPEVKKS